MPCRGSNRVSHCVNVKSKSKVTCYVSSVAHYGKQIRSFETGVFKMDVSPKENATGFVYIEKKEILDSLDF